MQQAMSIPSKDLGDDVASLAPVGVAQLSAGVAQLSLQGSPGTGEQLSCPLSPGTQ